MLVVSLHVPCERTDKEEKEPWLGGEIGQLMEAHGEEGEEGKGREGKKYRWARPMLPEMKKMA